MKYSKFTIAIFSVLFAICCANASAVGKEGVKAAERIEGQADFSVSAAFEGNSIVLSEPSDKMILNEIPVAFDPYKVFINMADEKNGYMLYCSTPESDRTKKVFYVTRDRWNTYSRMDIGFMLDE